MFWYLEVLRKYAEFSGRARRKEYWMFHLVNFIVFFLLFAAATLLRPGLLMGAGTAWPLIWAFFVLLICACALANIVPALAVLVRRLHDTGRSGWWWLISLVPLGSIVLLIFCVLDSNPGPNEYGLNPKGKEAYVAGPYGAYGTQAMAQTASGRTVPPATQMYQGFCSHCGTPLRAGIRVCSHCGKPAW